MNTIATTSNVNPSTLKPKQPQQRQTAKEIIATNVKSLIEQVRFDERVALISPTETQLLSCP